MKSKGMHPNDPNSAMMSPKKGNIAAKNVAMVTDNDRKINLGTTLRMENWSIFGLANHFSNTSFVGCKYIYN